MAGSAQIRQLRRRIRSVENTQKITSAMEKIAASRIVRAQRRVAEARPYAEQITTIIKGLSTSNSAAGHPLLSTWEGVNRVAFVILTSDRGLAGAYNANVLKRADRQIEQLEDRGMTVDLYLVGRKSDQHYKFRGRSAVRVWEGVSDQPNFTDAQSVAEQIISRYAEADYAAVHLVYTDFQSALTQVPTSMQLLPVDAGEFEGGDGIPAEFDFEPNPEDILNLLIPRYVEAKVFHGMLESAASEHASRQRAMKAATDNADDVVNTLSRDMNQARQDQVTTELTEIVGGASALSEG